MQWSCSVTSGFAEGAALATYGGEVSHHCDKRFYRDCLSELFCRESDQRCPWEASLEALLHQPLLHQGGVASFATIAITFGGVMAEYPELNIY